MYFPLVWWSTNTSTQISNCLLSFVGRSTNTSTILLTVYFPLVWWSTNTSTYIINCLLAFWSCGQPTRVNLLLTVYLALVWWSINTSIYINCLSAFGLVVSYLFYKQFLHVCGAASRHVNICHQLFSSSGGTLSQDTNSSELVM